MKEGNVGSITYCDSELEFFHGFSLDECGLPILLIRLESSKHSASSSNTEVLCQSSRETKTLRKLLEKELMNLEEFLFPKIAHWRHKD